MDLFDWRRPPRNLGAILPPVAEQIGGTCTYHSIVGFVEARMRLFVLKNKLNIVIPRLSVQHLIDQMSKDNPTGYIDWKRTFNYIQDRGLVASADYEDHGERGREHWTDDDTAVSEEYLLSTL